MSIIYVLIPIAVFLTALGIYLFFWAVKTDQFDDLEKQGMSILYDDNNQNAVDNVHKDSGSDENRVNGVSVDESNVDKNKVNSEN